VKYLVQLQYRTESGGVRLASFTLSADSAATAADKVKKLTRGTGEIVGGFVTCDPYKIEQWGRTRQAAY
jgi:hypothetical protein